MEKIYINIWIIFVNIKPEMGYLFSELIDIEALSINKNLNYCGAWANILIKAENIDSALKILPLGLKELHFDVVFIDKIENVLDLIENHELKQDIINEINWLVSSSYVFKISDRIFPYEIV